MSRKKYKRSLWIMRIFCEVYILFLIYMGSLSNILYIIKDHHYNTIHMEQLVRALVGRHKVNCSSPWSRNLFLVIYALGKEATCMAFLDFVIWRRHRENYRRDLESFAL